jgi:hypothetical protein
MKTEKKDNLVDDRILTNVQAALKAAGAKPGEFVMDRSSDYSGPVLRFAANRSIKMETRETSRGRFLLRSDQYSPSRLRVEGPWRASNPLRVHYGIKNETVSAEAAAKILAVIRRYDEQLKADEHHAKQNAAYAERCLQLTADAVATLVAAGYEPHGALERYPLQHGVKVAGSIVEVEAKDVADSRPVAVVQLQTRFSSDVVFRIEHIPFEKLVVTARIIESFLRSIHAIQETEKEEQDVVSDA